jgi:hypothetical protein
MLSDPGFESGTSGWTADTSGTLARVTSPTRSGAGALKVTPTSATAGKVGIAQTTLLTNLTRQSYYAASCWVMPTGSGLNVVEAMSEYSPTGQLKYAAGTSGSIPLDTGLWTYVSLSGGVISASGDKIIPEFYSTTATTKTGSLIFDDCSVTPVYIAPSGPPEVTPPGPPQSVTAVAGNGSATVSFAPPTSNGGGAITYYTVTATPSGLAASGSGSPLTITGLTNGIKYTFTARANNSAGTGPESSPSAAVTPQAPSTPPAAPQLLPDPGFESGLGGWTVFNSGTAAWVTSPVHAGTHAVTMTAASTVHGIVGLTQDSAVQFSTVGTTYTVQCWVRPSAAGLDATIRLLDYTRTFTSDTQLGIITTSGLPAGVWTHLTISAAATVSGDRIIPQIYSLNQTTKTGTITYDDCSFTAGG